MRSYCTVMVDVGYLLASAATYVTGSSLRRGVTVDYPALIAGLVHQAETDADLPLLRVSWYDSGTRPGGMPDFQQEEIGQLPRVKLRLGRLSWSGDQKGVDVRMGLDLAIQGRHRVADVVYLVSGDDDLTEAVEEAQVHGVQVVLLAVPDQAGGAHGVSKHLRREVDRVLVIDPETITGTVRTLAIPEELLPKEEEAAGAEAGPAGTVGVVPGLAADGVGADGVGADGVVGEVVREVGAAVPEIPGAVGAPSAPMAEGVSDADTAGAPRAPAGPANAGAEPTQADGRATPAPVGIDAAIPARAGAPVPGDLPAGPSPAVFARRRATGVVLPGAELGLRLPPPGEELTVEVVDAVAKRVVASWCSTATPESLLALRNGRPTIPAELDRALLLDLSGRAGDPDLDDAARHEVRARFWVHVDRVRMA